MLNKIFFDIKKISINFIHAAIYAAFFNIEMISYIIKVLLAFFAFPDFLECIFINISDHKF